jgi:methyl coenzyme M reductase subunit C
MNLDLNAKTWQSVISSVGLVAGGALTYAGVVSESSWTEIVQQAVNAAPGVVASISALISIGLAAHKAFQHTDAQVVQAASVVPGVQPIKITTDAAPALQAMAKDDSIKTVIEAAPQPSPYATSRQRQ